MPIPRTPKYQIGDLVTWELRDYREALEAALQAMPEHNTAVPLVRERLTEVITEQEARARGERSGCGKTAALS
jgi:hypothetical protein